ncbi:MULTISPECIES: hypothetical protein [unclassified Parafrankia]|uniref:hypothetical protein n=1 Tax=unclassified Parafrankia TaxID=2994368 RepID=UPI000DA4C65C|nr:MULTISPECIES: hypothetical protein [unclassified Parafrankia]TCJ33674.1 hypothetical protein E0504_36650 [Parafrankia sp. BMG5.11]SQD99060.1 conserved hypothetical protein [Parafrankia sp. Ea1.12]
MSRYRLVVLSEPTAGKEDEYNEWYDQQHLGDLVAIDGIESAQRFRRVDGLPPEAAQVAPQRYLALYEIETDNIEDVLGDLMKRAGTTAMPISEALDLANATPWVFEEIGEPRKSEPPVS